MTTPNHQGAKTTQKSTTQPKTDTAKKSTETDGNALEQVIPGVVVLNPANILSLQRIVGNRTVSRMIAQVKQSRKNAGPQPARQIARKPTTANLIQRDYAALTDTQKAQVDAKYESEKGQYKEKAEEFEDNLGVMLSKQPEPNAVANEMLQKTKKLVDAWASATGQTGFFGGTKDAVYEKEFAFAGGDSYYGAFEMTAKNIKKVFDNESQPLRKKLKIVYNAVRNNNMAKYLKLAAADMKADAKQNFIQYKTFLGTRKKVDDKNNPVLDINGLQEQEDVYQNNNMSRGFAKKSGLDNVFKANSNKKLDEIDTVNQKEGMSFGKGWSSALNWHKDTAEAGKDREGFQNWEDLNDGSGKKRRQSFSKQRTLKVNEIDDLTSAEIRHAMKQRGKLQMPYDKYFTSNKQNFKQTMAKEQMPWEQGAAFYKIKPGSNLEQQASQIEARLLAGVSGSTDLMMHAATYLGMEDKLFEMRLAMLGWMLPNRDHSFYEIMRAADSYGTPFKKTDGDPGKEYEEPENFKPITMDRFKNLLKRDGKSVFPRDYFGVNLKNWLADNWLLQSGVAVRSDAELADLISAGVPRQYIEKQTPQAIQALKNLKARVDKVVFKSGNGEDVVPYNQQQIASLEQDPVMTSLGQAYRNANYPKMMLAAMIKTKHGTSVAGISQDYIMLADTATMLTAQVDKNKTGKNVKEVEDPKKLKTPTHLKESTYWQVGNAKARVEQNSIKKDIIVSSIKKEDRETLKGEIIIRLADSADEETKKLPADEIINAYATDEELMKYLPKEMKDKLEKQGKRAKDLLSLSDKELGSIFKYTTAQYMPQITALNSLSTASYTKEQAEDQRNVNWGTPIGTLQYNLPALKGITSGLEKLPAYAGGDVYRGLDSTGGKGDDNNKRLHKRTVQERTNYLGQSPYKVGAVQSFNYPLSSSANLQASYIKKDECDIAFVISGVKSGKDIALLSNSPEEDEILFPPGSRFVITKTNPDGPDGKVYIYMTEI